MPSLCVSLLQLLARSSGRALQFSYLPAQGLHVLAQRTAVSRIVWTCSSLLSWYWQC
jgi:hypothetical protein